MNATARGKSVGKDVRSLISISSRVHTRARDTLILAVRPRREDGGEAPSRFLAEMSLHI